MNIIRRLGAILLTFGLVPSGVQGTADSKNAVKPFTLVMTAMKSPETTFITLTNRANDPIFALPTLAKQVQFKWFDSYGKQLSTQVFNDVPLDQGVMNFSFPNLSGATSMTVQELVQTPQTVRTEVLNDSANVFLRPDPSVGRIKGPATSQTGQAIFINATLLELNGTFDATCDVVLYVGDLPVDRADGVQISRGGMVDVLLSTTFDVGGTYTLSVKLENVDPDDYNPDNNSASCKVEVTANNVIDVPFALSYFHYKGEISEGGGALGPKEVYSNQTARRGEWESLHYDSTWSDLVKWPLTSVTVDVYADGVKKISNSLSEVKFTSGNDFVDKNGPVSVRFFSTKTANGDVIIIQSHQDSRATWSSIQFTHSASDIIYYSGAFIGNTGWYDQYTNVVHEGQMLGAFTQVRTDIRVGSADKIYGGNASAGLTQGFDFQDLYFTKTDGFNNYFSASYANTTFWTGGLKGTTSP